ncbi:MAG: phosphoribosylamine--glycine ligase, partial [Candidatus Omnitrophota bacterium]|nr:phosphoribosylamine--glycine ligase [Candidatus Omnitrophota bacterium]
QQSPKVDKVYSAPGNGGIREVAELVNIKADDIDGLLNFAKSNRIDLTVVGPEVPLVKGIVDVFQSNGLKIFGPRKELAMLEGSKIFAKNAMKKFGVPTAEYKVFDDADKAKKYLREKGVPIVVKADGLAAGKGVVIAKTIDEGDSAIDSFMVKKIFGASGDKVIIEDCLEGEEASILVFTDGKTIVPLSSSQDHKRIFDNDKGPNTGGMGAYSPAPVVSLEMFDDIIKKVFRPMIDGFAKQGKLYKGVLYAGIMITQTGPSVLEFNVRFGDPETQAVIPRLRSDLIDIVIASIDDGLEKVNLEWDGRPALCVVCSSKGYPGPYQKHKEIKGLDEIKKMQAVEVFHAGTAYEDGKVFTNGGRVLGVTGFGKDIKAAKDKAYEAVRKIDFEGVY